MIRIIAVIVLIVGICPMQSSVQALMLAGPDTRRIEVVAKRFGFEPNNITLKKGEAVTLVLKSTDVPHGLRFRELNVQVKATKSSSGEVTFTPEKTGEFVGHCSVFCGTGHGTMTLTLRVIG